MLANTDAVTPALQRYLDSFAKKPKNDALCKQYHIENEEFCCSVLLGTMNTPVRLDNKRYDYTALLALSKNAQGKRKNPFTSDLFLMTEVQADRETQQGIEAAIQNAATIQEAQNQSPRVSKEKVRP